jgi:hypothetical protein
VTAAVAPIERSFRQLESCSGQVSWQRFFRIQYRKLKQNHALFFNAHR